MNSILNRSLFFVKEHIGLLKAANNYDVLDPESKDIIMTCREPNLGFFTKLFRFSKYKRYTPFNVEINTSNGEKILTVKRGVNIFLSRVEVFDENNKLVGVFQQKFTLLKSKFDVLSPKGEKLCALKGQFLGWNFQFVKDNEEYAKVSKKWAGLGKELFTTADNYMLQIHDNVSKDDPLRMLIVAAVMCIDMVLKE